VILREVCPRDFYWFALVENDFPDIKPQLLNLLLLIMLMEDGDDNHHLEEIPVRNLNPLVWWMQENLISGKVMSLTDWLTSAFHLSKERWTDSVEWMESQPMSKVLLMFNIHKKYVEDHNKEMKRASRKK
jgi:hypothetical protein